MNPFTRHELSMFSFHAVGMIRIFGSPIARIRASVSSSHGPSAITNSSTSGRADRMDSTKGNWRRCAFRRKVKALIFIRAASVAQVFRPLVSSKTASSMLMATKPTPTAISSIMIGSRMVVNTFTARSSSLS